MSVWGSLTISFWLSGRFIATIGPEISSVLYYILPEWIRNLLLLFSLIPIIGVFITYVLNRFKTITDTVKTVEEVALIKEQRKKTFSERRFIDTQRKKLELEIIQLERDMVKSDNRIIAPSEHIKIENENILRLNHLKEERDRLMETEQSLFRLRTDGRETDNFSARSESRPPSTPKGRQRSADWSGNEEGVFIPGSGLSKILWVLALGLKILLAIIPKFVSHDRLDGLAFPENDTHTSRIISILKTKGSQISGIGLHHRLSRFAPGACLRAF